jgi:hypothetical protein
MRDHLRKSQPFDGTKCCIDFGGEASGRAGNTPAQLIPGISRQPFAKCSSLKRDLDSPLPQFDIFGDQVVKHVFGGARRCFMAGGGVPDPRMYHIIRLQRY